LAEQALWHVKLVTLAVPVPSVAAIRNRAWMVGPPLLLGLLAVLIATQLQASAWRSEAAVALETPNIPTTLIGAASEIDPERYMEAEVNLARSPQVAARVVHAARVPGITAAQFLRHSSAKPVSDASTLILSVSYRQRVLAVRLANAYGTAFAHYNNELSIPRALDAALARIQARIKRLLVSSSPGTRGYEAYQALVQQRSRLRTLRASLAHNASVAQRADSASSFRPHVLRNGILGGALGVLLGIALTIGVAFRLRTRP
jgi:hypothetical protein